MQPSTLVVALCAALSPLIPNGTALLLSRELLHRCPETKGDQSPLVCYETYHSNTTGAEMNCCRRQQCLDISSLPQLLGYCDSLRGEESRDVTLNLTDESPVLLRKPGIVCFGVGELI